MRFCPDRFIAGRVTGFRGFAVRPNYGGAEPYLRIERFPLQMLRLTAQSDRRSRRTWWKWHTTQAKRRD